MWALREIGREVRKEARKRAPVYSGDDDRAVPGELRKSIAPSRRLKRVGAHTYALVIGPRGARVHLYAPTAEARTQFMRRAYEAVMPRIGEIHARAWRKAMERR
jgi:hypothetical protein